MPTDTAQRLRDARLAANLTRDEVASLLMMDARVLARLEQGKMAPAAHQAEALARIYGVSVPWLRTGDQSAPPIAETPVTPLFRDARLR